MFLRPISWSSENVPVSEAIRESTLRIAPSAPAITLTTKRTVSCQCGPPESISQNQAVVDAYLGAHHDAPLTVEEEDRVLVEAAREIAKEESLPPGEFLSSDVAISDTAPERTEK